MIKKARIVFPTKLLVTSVLASILYIMAFYTLFGHLAAISSMLYFLLLFVVLHFWCMETYKIKFWHLVGGVSALAIVMSTRLGNLDFWTILSILVLHGGIVMLRYYLRDELNNKIRFSSMQYFVSGGYIFTVFVTIGYGIALIGLYTSFPFTCEGLSASSNQVVDTVTKPLKLGLTEATTRKDQAKIFFGANVKDVVTLDQQLIATQSTSPLAWLSKGLVTQLQTENVSTSMGICDYLLAKVNMEFGKPEFAASLILLLFLLLYPFIRIVVWVMSLVAFVVFKLCYLLDIYVVTLHEEKIEKIT